MSFVCTDDLLHRCSLGVRPDALWASNTVCQGSCVPKDLLDNTACILTLKQTLFCVDHWHVTVFKFQEYWLPLSDLILFSWYTYNFLTKRDFWFYNSESLSVHCHVVVLIPQSSFHNAPELFSLWIKIICGYKHTHWELHKLHPSPCEHH